MTEAQRQDRGFSRRPKILDYLGAGGLDEDEAREYAEGLVHELRLSSERYIEGPAPDSAAVRERREALQAKLRPDEEH